MDNWIEQFKYTKWNKVNYNKFIKCLLQNKNEKYKEFQKKLIPNNHYEIIGIKIPTLRKIAKKIYNTDYEKFINLSSNIYLEEVIIISILISKIQNKNDQIKYIEKYYTLFDNWCICDTFVCSMKCIKSNLQFYYNYFTKNNNRIKYVVLLNYYLNDEYIDKVINQIIIDNSNDYYINMAISWLLCEAYVNYKDKVLYYLDNCANDIIKNMTYTKIRQSKKIK